MSRFINRIAPYTYKTEIESMEKCKWKVNEICCNDKSLFVADYPYPYCNCESKKDCLYFEKEDGIIEENIEKGEK